MTAALCPSSELFDPLPAHSTNIAACIDHSHPAFATDLSSHAILRAALSPPLRSRNLSWDLSLDSGSTSGLIIEHDVPVHL